MTEYMNALITQMRIFAFASIALALTFDYVIYREGFVLKRIFYILLLIGAIASYNTILDAGCEFFASAKEEARTEFYDTMLNVRRGIEAGEKEAAWYQRIIYYAVYLILGLCDILAWLSDQVRRCIIVLYKVCCPIALGLAAWRPMSGIVVKFAIGTLWLCMWSIGTAVADLLIGEITVAALGKAVLSAGSSAAGAIVTGGVALGPALIVGVLVGVIVVLVAMVIFYLMIPFMMYSLLSGGELGHAAGNAMRTAVMGGAAAGLAAQKGFSDAKSHTKALPKNDVSSKSVGMGSSTLNDSPHSGSDFTVAKNGNIASDTQSSFSVMSDLADQQLANSKKKA